MLNGLSVCRIYFFVTVKTCKLIYSASVVFVALIAIIFSQQFPNVVFGDEGNVDVEGLEQFHN
jgi:hypothetical protein